MSEFLLLLVSLCTCFGYVQSRVLPGSSSIFSTDTLPINTRLMATVANGYVGMAVKSDTMYVGGVFNGHAAIDDNNKDISHRARIQSTNSFSFTFGSQTSNMFVLDVNDGVWYERYKSSNFDVNVSVYAHAINKNLLITQVDIDNTLNSKYLLVSYSNNAGKASSDINMTNVSCPQSSSFTNLTCSSGFTQMSEYKFPLINVVLVHFDLNAGINVSAGVKVTLYLPTVLLTSLESQSTILNDAVKLFQDSYSDRVNWLSQHITQWENIWMKGRIDVMGNDTVAGSVYSSLYYIIASIREEWPYGLSPGSLSSDDYSGHTFWDQASWMYPPLLMLHNGLGAGCLQYRYNRQYGAEITANTSTQNGLQGSMRYPWESAFSGVELQGTQWGTYEIHINADIPLAMQQYYSMTKNDTWLEEYYPMLHGVCLFWQDWSYLNPDTNLYEFFNVMGPDEYYYPVNNSAYTNFGAYRTLSFGIEASKVLKKQYPSEWDDIVGNVYIPFDESRQYHPESDNYEYGKTVKQADVIMLYFPWQFNDNKNSNDSVTIQTNDLNYYAAHTAASGPAMTWAMFVVNWLELGKPENAQKYFDNSFANIQHPFNIWTEVADGSGAINFITGAGGFLQQFIFGYPQMRIHDDYLALDYSYLPWTQMGLVGIDYLENALDFMFYQKDLSFEVTVVRMHNSKMMLELVDSNGEAYPLSLNQTVKVTSDMNPVHIQLS